MEEAWQEIQEQPSVTLSIDLFLSSILFLKYLSKATFYNHVSDWRSSESSVSVILRLLAQCLSK